MANGYFERGEIYWVSLGNGFTDVVVTRPGLIVSSDDMNKSGTVIVVFLTTKERDASKDVFTDATGKDSWIKCDNITSVSTNNLGKCIGVLNAHEMRSVESALDEVLDLTYVDDAAVKEKEKEIAVLNIQIKELREEVEELRKQIAAHADDEAAKKVELEMWQRLYDKALDQVCGMKLAHDMERRTPAPKPVAAPKPEPVKKTELVKKEEPALVDINSAKFSDLKSCGLSDNLVAQIIAKRPYKKVEDIKGVSGITATAYQIISGKLCCMVPEKPVAEEKPPVVEKPVGKVNVNTATAQEICDITGLSLTACFAITGKRKKNGRYISLDELVIPGRLSQKTLEKYRDKMEV